MAENHPKLYAVSYFFSENSYAKSIIYLLLVAGKPQEREFHYREKSHVKVSEF